MPAPANVLPPSLVVTTIVSAKRILLPLCDVILAQRTKKKKGANLMLFLKSVKPEDGMKLKLIPVHLSSIQFHELSARSLLSFRFAVVKKKNTLPRFGERARKRNGTSAEEGRPKNQVKN